MQRKHFLKSLLAGAVSAPALLAACSKTADTVAPATSTTGTTGTGANSCAVAPTETEGPFPTKIPASYVRGDIRDGKAGHLLTATITIANSNTGCAALAGALVDIWHSDPEGNYPFRARPASPVPGNCLKKAPPGNPGGAFSVLRRALRCGRGVRRRPQRHAAPVAGRKDDSWGREGAR